MKPYKLNLKRIIDTATRLEGKKVSISRAQMSEARRCIFAALYHESLLSGCGIGEFWLDRVGVQCVFDAPATKPSRRRHK